MPFFVSEVAASIASTNHIGVPEVGPLYAFLVDQGAESPASRAPTYIIKLEDAKIGEHLTLLQDLVGSAQKVRLREVVSEDHGLSLYRTRSFYTSSDLPNTPEEETWLINLGGVWNLKAHSTCLREAIPTATFISSWLEHFSPGLNAGGALESCLVIRDYADVGARTAFVRATIILHVSSRFFTGTNPTRLQLDGAISTGDAFFSVLRSCFSSTTVFANWTKLIWRSIFERWLACARKAIFGGLGIFSTVFASE